MTIATRIQSAILTVALVLGWTAIAGGLLQGAPPERAGAKGLSTEYTLLVGHPDRTGDTTGSVLIVPGTIIPAPRGAGNLLEQLEEAYRLAEVRHHSQYMKFMTANQPASVPSPTPEIGIGVTLLWFDESVATYRVRMTHDEKIVADTPVSVRIGGRAIVGSRDGDLAPYYFLVIEAGGRPEATDGDEDLTRPVILERLNPRYPEQARKSKIQGTVVLRVLVAEDGSCKVLEVVESPDPLLADAAVEAVSQWRYEPGRLPDGRAVGVEVTYTIRFDLR